MSCLEKKMHLVDISSLLITKLFNSFLTKFLGVDQATFDVHVAFLRLMSTQFPSYI